MTSLDDRLASALGAIRDRGQWRTLEPTAASGSGRLTRGGAPTVPAGTSRLRLALRSTHDEDDIDRLIAAIGDCL